MKNYLKKISTLVVLGIVFIGCSKSDPDPIPTPAAVCNTTGTEFQTIFGSAGTVTNDFDVHSYDFVLTQNKTVCKIGYQSVPYNVSNPYTIKILQGSTIIYNQTHIFNDTATSYVTPTTAINLTAGVTYTIERVQTNSGPWNLDNVGRVRNQTTYPVTSSFMSIVSSDFYFVSANGSVLPNTTGVNFAIPYIDIVFEQ
jgi:hypothetical protein